MLRLVTDEMTAESVLENETAGISCQQRFNAEKHETSPSCSVALSGGRQFRRLLSTGSNQDRLGRRIKLAERGVPIAHTVEIGQRPSVCFKSRCDL